MDEEYMAANAAEYEDYDAVADDAVGEDTEPAAGGEEGAVEDSAQQAQEEDVTRTQAFARRLREQTDSQIASAGIYNPITGQPVRTADELRAYSAMMRAEQDGRDPQQAAAEYDMRRRLSEYEDREQESAITANPLLSQYYDEYKDDARAIVEMARADGRTVSLSDALKAVMMQNWESVQQREAERIRQDTIKHYDARAKASPGPVSSAGTPPNKDYSSMSDADFDKLLSRALRGELMSDA